MAISADVVRLRQIAPEYVEATSRFQWRNFILLVLDGATFGFAISLVSEATIIPAFVELFTDSPLLVGVISASYALGRYLPQLLGSHLVMGRVRRKPLFLMLVLGQRLGLLSIALSASLIGLVPHELVVGAFIVSFAFYASTTGVIIPVYGDFVAKTLYRARGWLYGLVQIIGGTLGFFAAIWAEDILSATTFPAGHHQLFWTSFLLTSVSLFLIPFLKEFPYPHHHPRPPLADTVKRAVQVVVGDENYRRFLIARSMIALSTLGVGFVVVSGLDGPLQASDAAFLAAVFVLSQGVLGLVIGLMGNYFGWKSVVTMAGVLLALGMGGAIIADSLVWFIVIFIALGGANAVIWVGDPNMSIELAPPELTGMYVGLTFTLLAPFFIAGPLIAGALVTTVGYSSIFGVAAAFSLVGIVLSLRIREPRHHVQH